MKEKTKIIVTGVISYLIYLIVLLAISRFTNNSLFVYIWAAIYIGICVYRTTHYITRKRLGKSWVMVVVPLLALVAVVCILRWYPDKTKIKSTDLLSFLGDYLSFAGAFCLGCFIYQRGQSQIIEEKRKKVQLLLSDIEYASYRLMLMNRYIETYAIKTSDNQNPDFFIIKYDHRWREYYLEYQSLVEPDKDLMDWLEGYYQVLENVNICLISGDLLEANRFYEKYLEDEQYSISKYNESEAKLCLLYACDEYTPRPITWEDDKRIKKIIERIGTDYYLVIGNMIYNEVIRSENNKTSSARTNRKITDYILSHTTNLVEAPYSTDEKRIMMEVVFQCGCKVKKLGKVQLIWGEYSLISKDKAI